MRTASPLSRRTTFSLFDLILWWRMLDFADNLEAMLPLSSNNPTLRVDLTNIVVSLLFSKLGWAMSHGTFFGVFSIIFSVACRMLGSLTAHQWLSLAKLLAYTFIQRSTVKTRWVFPEIRFRFWKIRPIFWFQMLSCLCRGDRISMTNFLTVFVRLAGSAVSLRPATVI